VTKGRVLPRAAFLALSVALGCAASNQVSLLGPSAGSSGRFRMPVPFVVCDAPCPSGQMCIEPTADRGRVPACFPVVVPESLVDRRYWHRPLIVRGPRYTLRGGRFTRTIPYSNSPAVMLAVRDESFALRLRANEGRQIYADVIDRGGGASFPGSTSEYILGIARERGARDSTMKAPEFELLGVESEEPVTFPEGNARAWIFWDEESPMNKKPAQHDK
jgi:hypothetical protein